ncbi:MAG: hypothetical protein R2835_02410 [Thermomicrobiales bacterium]
MPLDPSDQLALAADDASLWASEQLVAAERDNRSASSDGLGNGWLGPQAKSTGVQQRSASQILHHNSPEFVGDRCQLTRGRARGEAFDPEVARVDLEQRARFGCTRAHIVGGIRSIRGAGLHKSAAALRDNVRDPESTADLDRFAPRNDDLFSRAKRRQHEQHGCRVVVDHEGRF